MGAESGRDTVVREFVRHRSGLFAYILSVVRDFSFAEEVLQEVAVVVCEGWGHFTPGTRFGVWAMRIARNKIFNMNRAGAFAGARRGRRVRLGTPGRGGGRMSADPRFDDLVSAYLDDALEPCGVSELNALRRSDPGCARRFVTLTHVHASLKELRSSTVAEGEPEAQMLKRGARPRGLLRPPASLVPLGMAAAFLVLVFFLLFPHERLMGPTVGARGAPEVLLVVGRVDPRLGLALSRHPGSPSDHFGKAYRFRIRIVSLLHPLAGGLTDLVRVYDSHGTVGWGFPADSAARIAVCDDNTGQTAIFAYEKSTEVRGERPAGRRVGFFLSDRTQDALRLTADGWKAFDAAAT